MLVSAEQRSLIVAFEELPLRFGFGWTTCLLAVACSVAPAQQTATPLMGKKICVADVANSSLQPIFTDRVKQALVDALQERNANADNTYTVTMLATHLALSGNNKMVFRREKCDFMLLSEVTKSRVATPPNTEPRPSASSPLAFDFALFKKGRPSVPLREGLIPIAASDDLTGAASAAAEKIASQVMGARKSK